MHAIILNENELSEYVESALEGDKDILKYYDRSQHIENIQDAIENVLWKIKEGYEAASKVGVEINGERVGYFVHEGNMLISFGLNKEYRNKEYLKDFWELIKEEIKEDIHCLLYSYNTRAIEWLKKCGAVTLFENVTVLKFENN